MEKSRYARVIEGEWVRGDDSMESSPRGSEVPLEFHRE